MYGILQNRRQVRTASLEQVRQPINNKSIGAWVNYKPHLTEMMEILDKMGKGISIVFVVTAFLLLNSCGFQPMYKFADGDLGVRNYTLKLLIRYHEKYRMKSVNLFIQKIILPMKFY